MTCHFLNRTKIVLVLFVAALSPSLRAQDILMTPQEIQSDWVGKTVLGLIGGGPQAGKTIDLRLKAGGAAEVTGAVVDSGTWRLSDKGYCATWKQIRAGQERCFTVVRKGTDLQVLNPDGSLNTTITAVK